jgi:hypothetical protein
LHFNAFRPAVLGGIVQGFLQNPEQAKSDFRGQRDLRVRAFEFNL